LTSKLRETLIDFELAMEAAKPEAPHVWAIIIIYGPQQQRP